MNYDNLKHPKLSPEEFEEKLVEYHSSKPVILDEAELRKDLKETSVHRYTQGNQLLNDLISSVEDALKALPEGKEKIKLEATIKNVDKAIVAFGYGHLGYNMCGNDANKGLPGHARPILWNPNTNRKIKK
ncbi:hypothetical protein [Pseudomonas sp. R76]|uniref:hypothetical protein n=1 Tax=Pseudomonas sp. R76 TaxID=1573711 RepID=UPI00131FE193|nr:hypothetical protein [Pseudomonas sp. R76]QHD04238.1 hypothetical protein PspR76_00140 [Pseudomonas sp. R76]